MTDTSGMLPNWLSEAVGDRHDPEEVARALLRTPEWVELIAAAIAEGEAVMRDQQSGPGGGFPSYNQEVARGIAARLAGLYPDLSLPNP
jgi:hypothetical protein